MCCYCFLGSTVVRDELTLISFSIIVFLLLLTLLFLRSLSVVSNSFYRFPNFSHTISRSLLMQPPIKISVFLASHFPSNFWASLCKFFISHLFQMTSQCILHHFLLKKFLHSQFIHVSLISSLNSLDFSYQVLFANLDILLLFLC